MVPNPMKSFTPTPVHGSSKKMKLEVHTIDERWFQFVGVDISFWQCWQWCCYYSNCQVDNVFSMYAMVGIRPGLAFCPFSYKQPDKRGTIASALHHSVLTMGKWHSRVTMSRSYSNKPTALIRMETTHRPMAFNNWCHSERDRSITSERTRKESGRNDRMSHGSVTGLKPTTILLRLIPLRWKIWRTKRPGRSTSKGGYEHKGDTRIAGGGASGGRRRKWALMPSCSSIAWY